MSRWIHAGAIYAWRVSRSNRRSPRVSSESDASVCTLLARLSLAKIRCTSHLANQSIMEKLGNRLVFQQLALLRKIRHPQRPRGS